ncbi:MAG: sugar phosphate isomerase/epimerase [Acidobacteria bacterium]|nr:sugar phosphate isomerase/epimerase [Acidobacteriota bacterium]
MTTNWTRRKFLTSTVAGVAALPVARVLAWAQVPQVAPLFKISLAQWSLHRELQSKRLDHLDFAKTAKQDFGIEAIEYVNSFFKDKARDAAYLKEMNTRAASEGVTQHLIMCDGEGQLGDPDAAKRGVAVENHRKWVDAARTLGCVTIRVNAASAGTFEEQQKLAADGLRRLTEIGASMDINVVVENHGGLSSHGQWLAGVMKMVGHPRCGTLPDFGNFYEYDKYQGVADLMPFAKAVSAKTHDFDEAGNDTNKDYRRLMKTVLDAGFRSWVGIEYEGSKIPEREGIAKTKQLLERVRDEFSRAKTGAFHD